MPLTKKQQDPDRIGAGVLFLCQGRILLIQRAEGERDASLWDIPGGGVPTNQHDLWQSAKREVVEEVGALPPGTSFAVRRHRFLSPATEMNQQKANIEYTTFLVELPPGAMKWKPSLGPEHTRYRWCNKREALGLNLLPMVATILKSHIWDAASKIPLGSGYIWAGSLTRALRKIAQADKVVASATNKLYDMMAKDYRYVRLEVADTVYRGNDSESVAGIYGAFRMPEEERGLQYFTLSLSAQGTKPHALLSIRDSRVRKKATASRIEDLFNWVSDTLEAT